MTGAQKARVRIVLEVMQYTGRKAGEIGAWAKATEWEDDFLGNQMSLTLPNDIVMARRGDWFVKGVHGIFVCRSEDFASTYELMEEARS